MNAAIIFEPDGYVLDGPRLMGRQSAGNGFLRAAVQAHSGEPIFAVTPSKRSADAFADLVRSFDPQAQPQWIPLQRLHALAERGVIYRPDLVIDGLARTRLRIGPGAFSICGVTHTLSTHNAAEAVAGFATAPLMPWDAAVCTSQAAAGFVRATLEAEREYLAWRFGAPVAPPLPQTPVIPLGVHPDDFAFSEAERAAARRTLGLAEGEVAALFAGRLTFNGKAHPVQMFRAVDAAARRAAQPLVLIMAGQFASPGIGEAFRAAAAGLCPSARVLFVDGKSPDAYRAAWRASDIFVSLSDSIQETFGLTPLEAMAAGLPVLVSDWNGYRDTVREGVDGFRIPSWAPVAGVGGGMAHEYDVSTDYELYLSRTSTAVSIDPEAAAARLVQLADDGALRRRLGEGGRAHVRQRFDWAVVYRQYQALWQELDAIRLTSANDPAFRVEAAPRAAPTRLDPFQAFAHYPTRHVGAATRVSLAPGVTAADHEALTAYVMLSFWKTAPQVVERLFAALGNGALRIDALATQLAIPLDRAIEVTARLAKLELVRLHAAEDAH